MGPTIARSSTRRASPRRSAPSITRSCCARRTCRRCCRRWCGTSRSRSAARTSPTCSSRRAQAARHVDVILAGFGFDGLFAGLPRHRLVDLANKVPLARAPLEQFYDFTFRSVEPTHGGRPRVASYAYFRGTRLSGAARARRAAAGAVRGLPARDGAAAHVVPAAQYAPEPVPGRDRAPLQRRRRTHECAAHEPGVHCRGLLDPRPAQDPRHDAEVHSAQGLRGPAAAASARRRQELQPHEARPRALRRARLDGRRPARPRRRRGARVVRATATSRRCAGGRPASPTAASASIGSGRCS